MAVARQRCGQDLGRIGSDEQALGVAASPLGRCTRRTKNWRCSVATPAADVWTNPPPEGAGSARRR